MSDTWLPAGASVRGARHVRRDEPSEDSFKVGQVADVAIAVVADGHGSPRCARADVGAQIATEVCFEVIAGWGDRDLDDLPEHIVRRWRAAVEADLAANPPSSEEAQLAPAPHHLLYGSTVLAAAVTATSLRLVQIGDGDILLGRKGIATARRPMPPLEVHRRGETDSLCQNDAPSRFMVMEYDLGRTGIDVIMLASDGLDTAFEDPSWYNDTMADLLTRVFGHDEQELAIAIETWCKPPAAVGGDDTTMALLVRSVPAAGTRASGLPPIGPTSS